MKNIFSAFGFLLISATGVCQVVNIPDANFKYYLISNTNINTNGDNEIQVSEAAAYDLDIDVTGQNISDLTGIEAFTMLTELYCSENSLTSLDVSSIPYLIVLYCSENQLSSLDISNNIELGDLRCDYNQLTSIDVSSNSYLDELVCNNNQLTSIDVTNNIVLRGLYVNSNQLVSLDVSNNPDLKFLSCSNNQLTTLDLSIHSDLDYLKCLNNELTSLNIRNGNNTHIFEFSAKYNPDLACIIVDNAAWSTANWTAPNEIDSTAGFAESEICNVGIVEGTNSTFTIFPNPATTHLTLNTSNPTKTDYTIYDVTGRILRTGNFLQNTTIAISDFAAGVYVIELVSKEATTRQKFIKQ